MRATIGILSSWQPSDIAVTLPNEAELVGANDVADAGSRGAVTTPRAPEETVNELLDDKSEAQILTYGAGCAGQSKRVGARLRASVAVVYGVAASAAAGQ